jgi:hypothetical protein
MEKAHWLGRKRASLKAAQSADHSLARLAHYDLAGRYSLKALSAETQAADLNTALQPAIRPVSASGTSRDDHET